jgi:hypothetical protein
MDYGESAALDFEVSVIVIDAVRMEGGTRHEDIVAVRWSDPEGGRADVSPVAAVIAWMDRGGRTLLTDRWGNLQDVFVARDGPDAPAGARRVGGRVVPHLRAQVATVWAEDLRRLPRLDAAGAVVEGRDEF